MVSVSSSLGTKRRWRRRLTASGLALTIGAGLSSAHAQSERDIITVTETRTPDELLDRASNASVLSVDDLALIAPTHPAELLNRAAGVNIHRNNGRESLIAIRSPVLNGGAGAGSFLLLENGVPLRAAGFGNVNALFDAQSELADRVEVIRGPGGPLYGSNALHGVVNFVPRLDFQAADFAEIAAGSFERYRGRGTVSGRWGAQDFRLGAAVFSEGNFRDQSRVDEQKAQLIHATRLFGATATTVASAHNLNQESAGFIEGDDAYRDRELTKTNDDPDAYRDARSARIATRIEAPISDRWSLTITPFARWVDQDFVLFFLPGNATESSGHTSIGSQIDAYWTPTTGRRVIFGAEVDATQGYLEEVQTSPTVGPFVQGVHYDYEVSSAMGAVFAQLDQDLGDQWRLSAGVRAEAVRYDYDTAAPPGEEGRFLRPEDRTDDFTLLVAKAGLVRRLGDRSQVYLSAARGARAPQTTDLYRLQPLQTPDGVEVETLDQVELGARVGSPSGGQVQLAAFYGLKENFFFRDADGLNVTDGVTRHRGVEATLDQPLTESLIASAGVTFARHDYRFSRAVGNASETITKGNDVDTAPRVFGSAQLAWSPLSALSAELEWVHMGPYYTNAANTNRYPGHDLINLRVTTQLGDGAEIFGSVRNAANVDYAERADFAFGNERYLPGRGRVFEIGLRTQF